MKAYKAMPSQPMYAMQRFLHKSISVFRFWTFFLSFFENLKYFWTKSDAENEL